MASEIKIASVGDAEALALVVSKANKDVAEKFGITFDNNPKHPSFCKKEWVLSDMERGEKYFLYQKEGISCGCVAFEQPNAKTAYLNRLAVLPEYRKNGIGKRLVEHILEHSRSKGVEEVSIGTIAEHTHLKNWYSKIGFIEKETKNFSHLPFNVTFMSYNVCC